ncbi:MAG: AbgT family transporter [Bacteroidales bacterium]|nr:AbgT family transporter [Bacteroidales bacterium]
MQKNFPHTWVIIFGLIVISAILTWFVEGGEYIEVPNSSVAETVSLTYKQLPNEPQTWQIFSAFFKGFVKQSGIIIFILMIGGAFWIMNASKAIDVGIYSFLNRSKSLEKFSFVKKIGINNIIMTLIMLMFSVFGAVFGMSEETIAFVIILVPLAISMGYDSITGVCLVYVAAHVGFAGAILNPFTIGIAQGLADVPLFSGFEYRIFCWIVLNILMIIWVLLYAKRVKKDPLSSSVYHDDNYWRQKKSGETGDLVYKSYKSTWGSYLFIQAALVIFAFLYPLTTLCIGDTDALNAIKMTIPIIPVLAVLFGVISIPLILKSFHFYILNILLFTILFLIIGVMGYQWYIKEIASLFFAMGIFSGIAMNKSPNEITKLFIEGSKDIMTAAVIVGLAGGIIVILEDGKIIATILHKMSNLMAGTGKIASVGIMYLIQNVINIVIPSGSAKAALTMPIMAPFSDLIGVSRQATIMAFQFGDGFTNMITPTSGVLIGVLGIARIPYHKWFKFIAGFVISLIILGFLLLIPTVLMELPGF